MPSRFCHIPLSLLSPLLCLCGQSLLEGQTVSISAPVAQATEAGSYPGKFLVTRTGDSGQALTVALRFGGSAVSGLDYEALSESVTIPAGQSSAEISLFPINDADVEASNDTVEVGVDAGTGYSVGSADPATITILNDDAFASSAPMLYKIEADSTTSLVAYWTDNFQTETKYRLQYRLEGSASWTTIDNLAPNSTSHRVTGLTEGAGYEMRVTAFQGSTSSQTHSPTPKRLHASSTSAPSWLTYSEWQEAMGLNAADRPTAGHTGHDPDEDQRPNLLEYLMGSDPLENNPAAPLEVSAMTGTGWSARWTGATGLLDAVLLLEETEDLTTLWQASPLTIQRSGHQFSVDDQRSGDRRFYRLKGQPLALTEPGPVVTCWGDSLTGNPGTYVSKLGALLPARTFQNCGIGGDTSAQILDRMVGLTITSPNPAHATQTAAGTPVRIVASRTTHSRIMSTSQRGNWATYAATLANTQKVEFFNRGEKIGESSTPLSVTVTSNRTASPSRLLASGHPFSTGDIIHFPSGPLPSPLVVGKTYTVRGADSSGFSLAEADIAFSVTASTATPSSRFVSASHPFVNGDQAWFRRGAAPPGLLSEKIYHVVGATAGDFALSETLGGTAISMVYNSSGAVLGKPGPAISLAADFATPTTAIGPFVLNWTHPGGSTSLSLRTHTDRDSNTVILWMGRNNSARPHETYAELKSAIRHIKAMNARFLIVSVTNGGGESVGSPYYFGVINLNSLLRKEFPGEFVDVRTALIRSASADANDQIDRAADIPPRSLRTDNVHFNDAGHQIIAEVLANELTLRGW